MSYMTSMTSYFPYSLTVDLAYTVHCIFT